MLARTCARAELRDGLEILELGCGIVGDGVGGAHTVVNVVAHTVVVVVVVASVGQAICVGIGREQTVSAFQAEAAGIYTVGVIAALGLG